jgi:hypothetical protein
MSSVVISGDTSGAITLSAPAIAGTNTLTLPAQTATIATLTTPSFATTIGVGGATAAASGAGITFPASQSASSNANTLDDYEEGTFTATLSGQTTAPTNPIAVSANYTKIGNTVTCVLSFSNVDTTGASGGMVITGLPFTSKAGARGTAGTPMTYGLAIPNKTIAAFLEGNSTFLEFFSSEDNSAWAQILITAGSTKFLFMTITYLTA